jgi:hypothetical protein
LFNLVIFDHLTNSRRSDSESETIIMTFYHDNKLTMVGLDSTPEEIIYAPSLTNKRKHNAMAYGETMPPAWPDFRNVGPDANNPNGSGAPSINGFGLDDPDNGAWADFDSSLYEDHDAELDAAMAQDYRFEQPNITDATAGAAAYADPRHDEAAVEQDDTIIKSEERDNIEVSLTPYGGSEYDESECDGRRPSKVPKLNKDGIPRKPRQPRPKLLKWDDNDWKNVALGLVWACGENGIQIPFDQASQVVSDSCTAGALQQALLKLRGKQIAEGFQIPSLRMAWTRKNKNGASSTSSANTKTQQGTDKHLLPKKKPTRFVGTQTKMVVLRRAYKDADRLHIAFPHNLKNAQQMAAETQQQTLLTPPDTPAGAAGLSSPTFGLQFASTQHGLPLSNDWYLPAPPPRQPRSIRPPPCRNAKLVPEGLSALTQAVPCSPKTPTQPGFVLADPMMPTQAPPAPAYHHRRQRSQSISFGTSTDAARSFFTPSRRFKQIKVDDEELLDLDYANANGNGIGGYKGLYTGGCNDFNGMGGSGPNGGNGSGEDDDGGYNGYGLDRAWDFLTQ